MLLSDSGLRIIVFFAILALVLALVRNGAALMRRYVAWRTRRERMRWFADEVLPQLMEKHGNTAAAARALQLSPAPPAPTSAAPPPPEPDAGAALEKLDEVLRRLPQSERERLQVFVKPPKAV